MIHKEVEKVVKAMVCGDFYLSERDYEGTISLISNSLGCDLRELLNNELNEANEKGMLKEYVDYKLKYVDNNSGYGKCFPMWKQEKGADMSFCN